MPPATPAARATPPRVGLLATLRNRRGLVTGVREDDGPEGRLHLVTIEYLDPDGPPQETVLWEAEPATHLLQPGALPRPDASAPMPLAEYRALLRATRWVALDPYLDPDGDSGPLDRLPAAAPLHGAIQAEDYQLLPLWQAMRMPRVTLLLADDVGLGKTIEAGMILAELVRRRRARRVLVLCPASLRRQWKQELESKFSLELDVLDRPRTHELRRRFGMDANPWRSLSRIITSYDYLKQPDVLASFEAASRPVADSPHLPWDLLIVDEAHNLSPAPIGEESAAAKLLRRLAPRFEHRLFLTATPHNGHTSCFTGLLEALDPVRFARKWEPLTEAEKRRVREVVVRRLKREVNDRARATDRPLPFADRHLDEVAVAFGPGERELFAAFSAFRRAVRRLVRARGRGDQLAGVFAVEILGKRLLSCPATFADSWHRTLEGARAEESATDAQVRAAERAVEEELADDREAERRRNHAATTVGAWLRHLIESGSIENEMRAVGAALDRLGLGNAPLEVEAAAPAEDARFDQFVASIDSRLRRHGGWIQDERLVVFTEYKTTLDHLAARLRRHYGDASDDTIRVLYGGLGSDDRDAVTEAFNDPEDAIRVLVATDTASEGLNLQETARYLFHYDVPWNPSRLEQRNGRLDRHGQARDVTVSHFSSRAEDDVRFLARIVEKVHQVREDLGSVGEVFDAALERRLIDDDTPEDVLSDLEERLVRTRGRAAVPRPQDAAERTWERGELERERLDALGAELDLAPESLRATLDIALGSGERHLEGPDDLGSYRLRQPIPTGWSELVDEHLRERGREGRRRAPKGTLRRLLFDPARFVREVAGRPVFRPEPGVSLLHLGHPMLRRALASFARFRFPGSEASLRASRWTLSAPASGRGPVPEGADALLFVSVEELAVNELRETFHHWVHTLAVPARRAAAGWSVDAPLPHRPPPRWQEELRPCSAPDGGDVVDLWLEVEDGISDLLESRRRAVQEQLEEALAADLERAREESRTLFASRLGELSTLIQGQTMERLEREIDVLQKERRQGELFDRERRLGEIEKSITAKEEELVRRRRHYDELREALAAERDRVLERVLPRRHRLHGEARLFPVGVEIVLPGAES